MGLHAEVAPHSGFAFTTRVNSLKERTSILKSFVAQGTELIRRLQHSRPEALNAQSAKKLVAFVSEGQDALNSLPLLESGKIQEPASIAALETTFEKLSEVRDTTDLHYVAVAAATSDASYACPLQPHTASLTLLLKAARIVHVGAAGEDVSASSSTEAFSQHRLCLELWP